ncbi:helix-turn-helix domain-containing protein [Rhodococcus sp. KRD162]|uniref:helix-turn-helix domain-containing protein n=1 Tax=Rhodococcus sp. KRD162 TaxID=2729725 RepID=UPI0019D2F33B|nr:helix-turn-helix domain-containing protein [Rhodococcus sp. KRD162]
MNSPPLRVTNAVLITAADADGIAKALDHFEAVLRRNGSRPTEWLIELRVRLRAAARTPASDAMHDADDMSLATLPIVGHDPFHDLLTSDAVADILGCTPGNARALAQRGTLRARCVAGRWLFEADSVRERAAQG